jgi:hypothetical protein
VHACVSCSCHCLLFLRMSAELPASSMAALGVLRAAWPKLPKGRVPNHYDESSRAYQHAIVRHKQVCFTRHKHKAKKDSSRWHLLCDSTTLFLGCSGSLLLACYRGCTGAAQAFAHTLTASRPIAAPPPQYPWCTNTVHLALE